jgi:hypothetical protein
MSATIFRVSDARGEPLPATGAAGREDSGTQEAREIAMSRAAKPMNPGEIFIHAILVLCLFYFLNSISVIDKRHVL